VAMASLAAVLTDGGASADLATASSAVVFADAVTSYARLTTPTVGARDEALARRRGARGRVEASKTLLLPFYYYLLQLEWW
jgi:hypothetical protein